MTLKRDLDLVWPGAADLYGAAHLLLELLQAVILHHVYIKSRTMCQKHVFHAVSEVPLTSTANWALSFAQLVRLLRIKTCSV